MLALLNLNILAERRGKKKKKQKTTKLKGKLVRYEKKGQQIQKDNTTLYGLY